ncbi:MAG TPA: c-type cytochrome [Anaeromyxobacteraceae bacterium]|nr:c-type cytochrome [Anaeromyxobacteraceae bacterium]
MAGCSGSLCLTAVPGAAPAADSAPGEAEAGRKAFQVCSACHTVDPGGPSTVGPNLFGVVGRDIAGVAGFAYSDALRAQGGKWTPAGLDRFMADPTGVAPGTRMAVKVADARQRGDLIAYLGTLRQGAAVAPSPAPDFGPNWPAGPGQVEAGRLCAACHSLAIVKQQRLSRARWDKLLDWMVESQGMAAPAAEQRALILDYLAAHFGAPK